MYKIVFIDDEAITLKLLEALLDWNSYGIEVAGTAGDGYAGLELCRRVKPDIVIMDIKMPHMTGVDLSEMLRKSNQTVKLIFLSAYAEFEYAQSAISNRVSGYLLKPVDEEKLDLLIRKVLEEIRSESRIRTQSEQFQSDRSVKSIRDGYMKYLKKKEQRASGPSGGTSAPDEEGDISGFPQDYTRVLAVLFSCPAETDELPFGEADVRAAIGEAVPDGAVHIPAGREESFVLIHGSRSPEKISAVLLRKNMRHRMGVSSFDGELRNGEEDWESGRQKEENAAWDGIYQAMEQAERAAEHGFFTGNVISYACPVSREIRQDISFQQYEPAISHMLETGDPDELCGKLSGMVDEECRGEQNYRQLCGAVQDVLIWLRHAAVQAYPGTECAKQLLRHAGYERIRACSSPEALKAYLLRLMKDASALILQEIEQTDASAVVRKARAYVAQHYGRQDFSLQETADYIGMSKNHFSRVFHNESGMKFWDYVTEIRIRRAKQLLTNPQLPIADISRSVGYETESHFNRKFKQLEGVTPGKYRKEFG